MCYRRFEFLPRVPCRDDGIWLFRRLLICRLKVTESEAVPEPSTVILALSGLVAAEVVTRTQLLLPRLIALIPEA